VGRNSRFDDYSLDLGIATGCTHETFPGFLTSSFEIGRKRFSYMVASGISIKVAIVRCEAIPRLTPTIGHQNLLAIARALLKTSKRSRRWVGTSSLYGSAKSETFKDWAGDLDCFCRGRKRPRGMRFGETGRPRVIIGRWAPSRLQCRVGRVSNAHPSGLLFNSPMEMLRSSVCSHATAFYDPPTSQR
jgi:hypothetical protein